jgi:crossover junction endodeoxyribonuclease RusA
VPRAQNPFTLPDSYYAALADIRRVEHDLYGRLDVMVYGTPKPQGSKDYKGRRKNGSAILVESADVMPWRAHVAHVCRSCGLRFSGPVSVDLRFCMRRPQRAKLDAPADRKPDVDKLARAVLDALTDSGVIEDDARVVDLHAQKILVGPGQTGCRIVVTPWRIGLDQ